MNLSYASTDKLVVSTSCSLLHTAVDLVNEPKLDKEIKSWLAFAAQKVVEVNALAKALSGQKDGVPHYSVFSSYTTHYLKLKHCLHFLCLSIVLIRFLLDIFKPNLRLMHSVSNELIYGWMHSYVLSCLWSILENQEALLLKGSLIELVKAILISFSPTSVHPGILFCKCSGSGF
jgi:hypothetical protein